MKNIKDITISIFAIIGFIALVTGFTNKTETQEPQNINYGTPESHVWEMHSVTNDNFPIVYSINKKTGEVRQHSSGRITVSDEYFGTFRVSIPK